MRTKCEWKIETSDSLTQQLADIACSQSRYRGVMVMAVRSDKSIVAHYYCSDEGSESEMLGMLVEVEEAMLRNRFEGAENAEDDED